MNAICCRQRKFTPRVASKIKNKKKKKGQSYISKDSSNSIIQWLAPSPSQPRATEAIRVSLPRDSRVQLGDVSALTSSLVVQGDSSYQSPGLPSPVSDSASSWPLRPLLPQAFA